MKRVQGFLLCIFCGMFLALFLVGPIYISHMFLGDWGVAGAIIFILGTGFTAAQIEANK